MHVVFLEGNNTPRQGFTDNLKAVRNSWNFQDLIIYSYTNFQLRKFLSIDKLFVFVAAGIILYSQ